MTVKACRKAIYDVVKAGKPQWNGYAFVPPRPVFPAFWVCPSDDTTGWVESYGRGMVWLIDVYVAVAYSEMESAQDILDDEISPDIEDSIIRLLMDNDTLDGRVDDCSVKNVMFYGQATAGEAGGAPFIGVQIRLEVRERQC